MQSESRLSSRISWDIKIRTKVQTRFREFIAPVWRSESDLAFLIKKDLKRHHLRASGNNKGDSIIDILYALKTESSNEDTFIRESVMKIRPFDAGDAENVSSLVVETLRVSNSKDYSSEHIEKDVESSQPKDIIKKSKWTHFYVAEKDAQIIGCGAIGPFYGKEDEGSLYTIFVLPEYQGHGIGKELIKVLEQDEFFLRAKRIEVPASITAAPFYEKMGYTYKFGCRKADEEGLIRMEKHR